MKHTTQAGATSKKRTKAEAAVAADRDAKAIGMLMQDPILDEMMKLHIFIPVRVHRTMKLYAAAQGTTMREISAQAIEEFFANRHIKI